MMNTGLLNHLLKIHDAMDPLPKRQVLVSPSGTEMKEATLRVAKIHTPTINSLSRSSSVKLSKCDAPSKNKRYAPKNKKKYQRVAPKDHTFDLAYNTPRPDDVDPEKWEDILDDCVFDTPPLRNFYRSVDPEYSSEASYQSCSDYEVFDVNLGDDAKQLELSDRLSLLCQSHASTFSTGNQAGGVCSTDQSKRNTPTEKKKRSQTNRANTNKNLIQSALRSEEQKRQGEWDAHHAICIDEAESGLEPVVNGALNSDDHIIDIDYDDDIVKQSKAIHSTKIEKIRSGCNPKAWAICMLFVFTGVNLIDFQTMTWRVSVNAVIVISALILNFLCLYCGGIRTTLSHPITEEPKLVDYREIRDDIESQVLDVRTNSGLTHAVSANALDYTQWQVVKYAIINPKNDIRGPNQLACQKYKRPQVISLVRIQSNRGSLLMSAVNDKVSQHLSQQAGKTPQEFYAAAKQQSRNCASYNISMAMTAEDNDIHVASLEHWASTLKRNFAVEVSLLPQEYF
jgi:hypothetical protein